ncbi:hypothetical protein [Enterococcus faecium]|uniref:hypothetical protein n=1 Tax=Enterococcus faecium TaxID=1352 RepID=UPI0030C7EE53
MKKIGKSYFIGEESNEVTVVTITLTVFDDANSMIDVNESVFNQNDPDIINKMPGQKEGLVYMLACLKA